MRELQLATLVDAAPEGEDWLHEQKFDGYRILAVREGTATQLWSRRFKDWTAPFAPIAAAVAKLDAERCVLDGEVAVITADGRTSFQALQNADAARLTYFAFDLLELDGVSLIARPLEQRKAALAQLIGKTAGPIRYSDHVIGRGGEFFKLACAQQLEGIVSKRRAAPYTPGRGTSWVKTKCIQRQELVIGGWTDPDGARSGFGALLVGYHDQPRGKLIYAGKVGTGFTSKILVDLGRQFEPLATQTSPFTPVPPRASTGANPHWLEPTLVAEIAFSEWTTGGHLRHPSFKGLRADKRAKDVIRERPEHLGSRE